jgi:DNA-binding Xre family transcriptional regulator
MSKKTLKATKLQRLLFERGLSQTDLYHLIEEETGKVIGKDRISKLVNGHQKNLQVDTAKAFAKALDVKIDDIIED